ncbi:hypothetical protein GCM10022378_11440 [Salinicoccus jeotgali]|uniref:Uncharacterized protein n=1 Tax=Salinicoccus jeotgali TaxID=381634 RepID=A0ABP7EWC3_9STAP
MMTILLATTIGLLVVSVGLNAFLFITSFAFYKKINELEK